MDVAAYLQRWESSMSGFMGDDPLEQWDKFVELLVRKLPPDSSSQLTPVLTRLVETFLHVEKYANDERFIGYCIKCASCSADPDAWYRQIFSKGVGHHSAALYVSWAQQLEQRGLSEEAEAVYQMAFDNQAQPNNSVLHEYRNFQSRTKPPVPQSSGRKPLQNSNSANMKTPGESSSHNKPAVDCQPARPAERRLVTWVSRSEYSGKLPPSSNENLVPAYDTAALQCEGSELCFEEVRAQKYFQRLQQQQQQEQEETKGQNTIDCTQHDLNAWMFLKESLEHWGTTPRPDPNGLPRVVKAEASVVPSDWTTPAFNNDAQKQPEPLVDSSPAPRPPGVPQYTPLVPASVTQPAPVPLFPNTPAPTADLSVPAPDLSASMSHHAPQAPAESRNTPTSMSRHAPAPAASVSRHESVLLQTRASDDRPPGSEHGDNEDPLEQDNEANVSQGATANLSRVTPNSSLGYIQATPSRALPSPTVNTREALDVIMDMFQAPTFIEEPFPNASEETNYDVIYTRHGPSVKPAAAAPFTIFQDKAETENKENCSAPPAVSDKAKAVRALGELPKLTKPNDVPSELAPDESTTWGAQLHAQNSLAACPNSTSDFAMLARFVSTPSTYKTPLSTAAAFFPDQENGEGVEEDGFGRRCTKKLSPIMEQSPLEDNPNDTAVTRQTLGSRQGTIVGEGLAMNTQFMTTSSTTMVQPPPPAVLSFRDHTLGPNNTAAQRSTGPGWEVYTSPGPTPTAQHEPFTIIEDMDDLQPVSQPPPHEPFTIMEDMDDLQPASQPEAPQDVPMSPESAPRPDWLAVQSADKSSKRDLHTFLTPRRVSHHNQDVPMSPQVDVITDAHMTSPKNDPSARLDVSVLPETPRRSRTGPLTALVPDPWNDELVAHLLASTDPPLLAHPRCVTWQCNLPNIAPKMTLSMGNASLRVDSVVGEGAFAKVYQATDPVTSDKMVLKVQKPANPWEFYINTQLDARLPPSIRHFYSSFHSAYLFNNGSVLLGEMHNYGTLLNAVNMYRTLGDKVMPQPLVMYFTLCILHMMEELHRVGIIHADVKPDNFLLGERFLEQSGLDSLDHGLVLIDLGQSIDMRLFPEGAAFTAKCLTSGFQCTEMQTGKPWNYHTDYFGVAGTVYCMLFGTYMQVVNDGGVWRTNGVFRRNPHSDLWQEFFHTLLNVPDCSRLPDLSALRQKLRSVLEQTYSSKVASLKSRLVVLLLENSRRAQRR